jgi:hypothetical protein
MHAWGRKECPGIKMKDALLTRAISTPNLYALLAVFLTCSGTVPLAAAEKGTDDPRDFLMMKLYEAALKYVDALESKAAPPSPVLPELTSPSNQASTMAAMSGDLYGCALWLEVNRSTNASEVSLTLHNTIPGTNYQILSKTNFTGASWITETNVTGATGQDWTQVMIPTLQRSNLFFIASPMRSYSMVTNFPGIENSIDDYAEKADTMGAVGPEHFVELINLGIAVFSKSTGVRLEAASITNFFAAGSRVVDPRILYDHQAQRWVACAIDLDSGNAVLAVTTNSSPLGLLTNWVKYPLLVHRTGVDTDYSTLGLDDNGIYVTVHHRAHGAGASSTNAGHTIVAIKKPEIWQGTFITNYFDIDTNHADLKVWTVQPAVNFDSITTNTYAWLIAKGPPQMGTNYRGGEMLYRRLQWSNSTARLVDTNWQPILQSSGISYRDYYDADGTNILTRPQTTWLSAPQAGSTTRIDLSVVGSRLMNAVIRGRFLYTCQHVGLSGTNGAYTGNEFGTNADRSGVQWLKLRVEPGALSYYAHGRIYDACATNANHYYFPSVAVNCAADILFGFSGSSSTNYIGGYYVWRPSVGTAAEPPVLFRAGDSPFPETGWGDYSATTLDPDDATTFWTIQEYSKDTGEFGGYWATWVAKIRRD